LLRGRVDTGATWSGDASPPGVPVTLGDASLGRIRSPWHGGYAFTVDAMRRAESACVPEPVPDFFGATEPFCVLPTFVVAVCACAADTDNIRPLAATIITRNFIASSSRLVCCKRKAQ
jgi:hypothetical protein